MDMAGIFISQLWTWGRRENSILTERNKVCNRKIIPVLPAYSQKVLATPNNLPFHSASKVLKLKHLLAADHWKSYKTAWYVYSKKPKSHNFVKSKQLQCTNCMTCSWSICSDVYLSLCMGRFPLLLIPLAIKWTKALNSFVLALYMFNCRLTLYWWHFAFDYFLI